MDIQPNMQSIINTYYSNEAKELHKMVDKVLKNLHFTEVDTEDFYSLATDIFVSEVIPNYNPEKPFESFLYIMSPCSLNSHSEPLQSTSILLFPQLSYFTSNS